MDKRLILPLVINSLLTILLGLTLEISLFKIVFVLLYSSLVGLVVFSFLNKGLTIHRKKEQVFTRFGYYLKQTSCFQIVLVIYLAIRFYLGVETWLIFFYGHLLMMVNLIGYLACLSQTEMKEE